jgi:hypothetical protein
MLKIESRRVKFWFGIGWLFVLVLVLFSSFYKMFKDSIHFNPEIGINLIVVLDDNVSVLAIRPGDEPSSFVKLPENLLVEAYGTDGEYKVGNLWRLGETLKVGGGEMVDNSIGDALGFFPGGYIKINNDNSSPVIVMSELLNPLAKTNLWWWDRVVLWKMIKKEISDFSLLNVSLPTSLYESSREVDGVMVDRLASESIIDSWGRRVWLMESVLSESAQVEIFNHSGEPGKASQMARKLSNAGMGVLKVGEGDEGIETFTCTMSSDTEKFKQTLYFFNQILSCDIANVESGDVFVIRIK